jgi:ABC-type dipeptide/oligopeptide/nickel transport system ATPase component
MAEGEIIEEGRVEQVLTEPRQEFSKRLLAAATDLPKLEMDLAVATAAQAET